MESRHGDMVTSTREFSEKSYAVGPAARSKRAPDLCTRWIILLPTRQSFWISPT
jgi:hypothetical protein